MKRRVTTDLSSRDCSSVLGGDEDRSLAFSITATATGNEHTAVRNIDISYRMRLRHINRMEEKRDRLQNRYTAL